MPSFQIVMIVGDVSHRKTSELADVHTDDVYHLDHYMIERAAAEFGSAFFMLESCDSQPAFRWWIPCLQR